MTINLPNRGLNGMSMWSEWDRCPPGAALRDADPEIARLIDREVERQLEGLELIASENLSLIHI